MECIQTNNKIIISGNMLRDDIVNFQNNLLQQIKKTSATKIYFDLKNIKKVDSSAVAILIELFKSYKKQQKEVFFQNIPKQMQELIAISNLEEIFIKE